TSIGFHRQFQVYESPFVDPRERSTDPCLGSEIGTERIWLDIERSEANSTYRDAVTGSKLFRSFPSLNRDPSIFSALLNAGYSSDFFYDSSKHVASGMN